MVARRTLRTRMHPVPKSEQQNSGVKIKAAVMRNRARPFKFETLSLDAPRADEVLVRIVATGVCHTDMVMRDDRPDMPMPAVLGHEGAGVVERVGAGVRKVAPGDHVVMTFMSCGRCRYCQRGEPAYCEKMMPLNFSCAREDGTSSAHSHSEAIRNHFFGQSSFATYALANERNVVKVPKSAQLELLGPLGCGLQTGAGAVMNSLKVKVGESLAVFGAGSVGLAAVMAARVVGATTIIAIDVVESRLRLAKRIGATHVINGKKHDPVAAISKITQGRGLDYTLDTTGLGPVFTQAVESPGIRGACGFVTGGINPVRTFDARRFMAAGKRIVAIVQGDSVPDVFIPYLLKLHAQGRFPFDKMVKFYSFRQINRAFHDSHSGVAIKPIIRMG
jgi:aryl-alcohol dehydrogenase